MIEQILPIDYLKSALSVSTFVGCPLNCKYCIVGEISEKKAKRISSPEKIITQLLDHSFFIKNITPLMINNKTDPLLPQVKEDTFKILKLLQKYDLKNPRILITKMELSPKDLQFLEGLNKSVFILVSYSNLKFPIEIGNFKSQKLTLETLKKRKKVKALHYWRPLMKGLNDSEESILEIFNLIKNSCEGSIISGIRLTEDIKYKMESYGANFTGWNGDKDHKYLSWEIIEKIVNIRNEKFPNYPLYRHTSCGLNATSNLPDWGFNFLKGKRHCLKDCKNNLNCKLKIPKRDKVEDLLIKINLNPLLLYFKKDHIFLNEEISQDQRAFLLHSLRYPIKAKKINKSFSEKLLLGKNDE
jgi:DNA repair photolyase